MAASSLTKRCCEARSLDQPAFEEGVHTIDDDERGDLSESINLIIDDVK
ncbi:hypothetical protein [Natrialba hulunbeirensis]|nr:hypothetical protein [Natrialba hulunbeirensis]